MYGYEWGFRYLWRWMNWLQRLDVIVLGLMLVHIVAVVILVACRCHSACRIVGIETASSRFQRARRRLIADLSLKVSSLKSIASTAPLLGLAGTCFGILNFGRAIAMEKNAALALMASDIAKALVTTATGILVAVPATCSYNYLSTRIDLLEIEIADKAPFVQKSRRHPLSRRPVALKLFSQLSAFALSAAPILALVVVSEMPYFFPRVPTGIVVDLPSTRNHDRTERLVVLRVTSDGTLFLNQEPQEWQGAAVRLSEIYRNRKHRTLYLVADDAVPFQTVAEVMDLVKNLPDVERRGSMEVRVCLVTPTATNDRCTEPVEFDPGEGVSL